MRPSSILRFGAIALLAAAAATLAPSASAQIRFGGIGPVIPPVTPPRTLPPIILLCTDPTDAQCADPNFVGNDQPAGSCAATQRTTCIDRIKSRFQSSYDAAGPMKKMFRPGLPTEPWNLVSGRVGLANGAGVKLRSTTEASYQGEALASTVAVASAPSSTAALTYRRGAGYVDDGTRVDSCSEYAYKTYWDYSTFKDDVTACRGDARCVYDAAYAGAHPVASRTLKERNGVTDVTPQIAFEAETLDKNPFFSVPIAAITKTNADAARTAQIDALIARLKSGKSFYSIGVGGSGPNAFATGWDYHRALHDRTIGVTDAELDEYAQRRAKLQSLVEDYYRIWWSLQGIDSVPVGTGLGLGGLVLFDPVGTVMGDPTDWMRAVRQTDLQLTRAAGGPVVRTGGLGTVGTVGGVGGVGTVGTVGTRIGGAGNVAVPVTGAGAATVGAGAMPPTMTTMSTSGPLEAVRKQITALLLDEMARDGRGGCLDPSAFGCDWAPSIFADKVTHAYDQAYDATYRECRDIAAGTFATIPDASKADAPALKTYIDETKMRWRAQLAQVPQYPNAKLGVVGSRRTASNELGDPSLFSAGYDYDVGWQIAKTGILNGAACGFTGHANANIHARVSALGYSDPNSPIEYLRKLANVVRSDSTLDIRADRTHFDSSTLILDNKIYDPIDEDRPSNYTWALSTTPAGHDQVAGVSATFVIIVVPVTLQASVEVSYGAYAKASTQVVDACGGSPMKNGRPDPKFGFDLTLTPWANVDGYGTVIIGVPGFGVGARGQLALVHVAVPMSGGATVAEKTGDPNTAVVRFDTHGDLQMNELEGKVSLFAEMDLPYPIPDIDYEKELFSWNGYRQDFSLWKATAEVELGAFNVPE